MTLRPSTRRRPYATVDVTRLERERGWLGTVLTRDPENPDPRAFMDPPEADLLRTAETDCPVCGAGEHEECGCWKKGTAA